MSDTINIDAPYFEDFQVGQEFEAPAVTLTGGCAALYQAITGDRMRLALDHHAARLVTGSNAPLVHPLLVTNMAIGQSTWPSQHAKANLFYRGLVLLRQVHVGETLATRTRVVGLRQNRAQIGRAATGLVALEMVTCNQDGQEVLRFWRCPMVPCRHSAANAGSRDDLDAIGADNIELRLSAAVPVEWKVKTVAERWSGLKCAELKVGMRMRIEARDTVTTAPELVRLTLNMAMMHTDAQASYLNRRLVYGGHTLGIAFAHVTRALPNLITILGWESVDHTGPVLEGDRLRSELSILEVKPTSVGGMVKLFVRSYSSGDEDRAEEAPVLDWTLWALCA